MTVAASVEGNRQDFLLTWKAEFIPGQGLEDVCGGGIDFITMIFYLFNDIG